MDKKDISPEKMNKLWDQLLEKSEMINHLSRSIKDIDILGRDVNNTYALSHIDGGKHHVLKGEDGIIYIQTSLDAFSIHEIAHVRQSLTSGGLKFKDGYLKNAKVDKGMNAAAKMEIEAYKMQYSFSPASFPYANNIKGVNYQSVGDIRDESGKLVYDFINIVAQREKIKNKIKGD